MPGSPTSSWSASVPEGASAKPVLVTTDWLAEHLDDVNLVVAEVDENPDLCTTRDTSRAR